MARLLPWPSLLRVWQIGPAIAVAAGGDDAGVHEHVGPGEVFPDAVVGQVAGEGEVAGEFELGGEAFEGAAHRAVTDDARPTINGTAEAGMTVSVYIDGKLSGTTLVAANGEWSFTPTNDLADGLHNITAKASNGARPEEVQMAGLSWQRV